jgi:hypothetical protein
MAAWASSVIAFEACMDGKLSSARSTAPESESCVVTVPSCALEGAVVTKINSARALALKDRRFISYT